MVQPVQHRRLCDGVGRAGEPEVSGSPPRSTYNTHTGGFHEGHY